VIQQPGHPAVLYVDLHLVHEVTSPQAFAGLRQRKLGVRRPDRTVATMDHTIPTRTPDLSDADPLALKQIREMERNAGEFGIRLYGQDSPRRGIVHVIGPELGMTQPGMTIVCGDSHTATHGAFGALAFGIGTTEVEHVLATQCLLQSVPRTFEVRIEGRLGRGVTSKDLMLSFLARVGIESGLGHVFEYSGHVVRSLSMEERMTLCNMSIEGGARAGMIAPDQTTFEYLAGREFIPRGDAWEAALARWRALPTDDGAIFDRSISLDASALEPMITYGTSPGTAMRISDSVPDPDTLLDLGIKASVDKGLRYMAFRPGQRLLGHPIHAVFIGSCTNSRLSDLRLAASLLKGRKVAPNVRVLIVPGSQEVKRQAEAERLDRVFLEAGAEWRHPGCSMCIAMNGDELEPGQYAVSTSNRNFEGRQGKGGRTLLASPLTAAAAAVTGKITDPRTLM
jgi:3-isopropylmalate/(R)-2-methylmalate dehydratase large subunit